MAYKYDAFISYKHIRSDALIAVLARKILGSTTKPVGARGGVALRVFRDTQELSAQGSLPAALKSALGDSAKLVVVVSSASMSSPWVREELGSFLEAGRSADIIGLALEEPSALASCGDIIGAVPRENILDIRAPAIEGSIRRLKSRSAELKAMVTGSPLAAVEAAERKDGERARRRILLAVIGCALLCGLAVFGLGRMKECAETDALIQEKLVKRNLFDIAERVNDGALLAPELQKTIEGYIGSEKSLLEESGKGKGPADAAAGRDRDSILGNISYLSGDIGSAIDHYGRSVASWESEGAPRSLGDLISATNDLISLGNLESELARYDDAISHYDRAIELNGKFLDRRNAPGFWAGVRLKAIDALAALRIVDYAQSSSLAPQIILKNIAAARQRKAKALLASSRLEESIKEYNACIGAYGLNAPPQPSTPTIEACEGLSKAHFLLWNLDASTMYAQRVASILRDGDSRVAPEEESLVLLEIHAIFGDIAARKGNYQEALAEYGIAKGFSEKLGPRRRSDWRAHQDWMGLNQSLACVLAKAGQPSEAGSCRKAIIDEERAILRRIEGVGLAKNESIRRKAIESRNALALALLFDGQYSAASDASAQAPGDMLALSISIVGSLCSGDSERSRWAIAEARSFDGKRAAELRASCRGIIRELSYERSDLPAIEARYGRAMEASSGL